MNLSLLLCCSPSVKPGLSWIFEEYSASLRSLLASFAKNFISPPLTQTMTVLYGEVISLKEKGFFAKKYVVREESFLDVSLLFVRYY